MENVNPEQKFTIDNRKKQKNTVLKNTTSFLNSDEDKLSYGVNPKNTPLSISPSDYGKGEGVEEKQILIDNLKINYKQIGNGNVPIILLHGWGVSSDKYIETARQLSLQRSAFSVFLLDLPGFGKSDAPREVWGVDEYVELVKKMTKLLFCHHESASGRMKDPVATGKNIFVPRDSSVARLPQNDNKNALLRQNDNNNRWFEKFILIGHSFGGQIAIKFAAKYPERLKALILTGAAGIRHRPTLKQKIFYYLAKIGKIIFSLPVINKLEKSAQGLLYKAAQEKDYYAAQGIMKEIFKKVIKENLTDDLEKINIPTLLIWGKNDRSTPLKDGQTMHLKIQSTGKRSKLEIINEANHSLPYQFSEKFAKIIIEFIKNL